ncbi:MAG: hypothetical protein KDA86_16940 [Planctomycetaceae bacterium]|nr:hypothetical protein [Planctomycetaceae bacterium]
MRSFLISLVAALSYVGALSAADVQLPAELDLSMVTDRSELSFEESTPYYSILSYVKDVPASDLSAAAAQLRHQRWEASEFKKRPENEFPIFVDLIQNPAAYRGQPVTLSGHLIRLIKSTAGPNDFGIDTLYEGWLVTEDSQQHPATIICTELPPGMPIGEETIDGVSVTGYFLKLRTYPSRDRKIRFAPLILTHTMSWNPVKVSPVFAVSPIVLYGGLAACTIIVIVIAWLTARRNRQLREARYRNSVPDNPPDFLESLTP